MDAQEILRALLARSQADPCHDCGGSGGHPNTGNVRPARLAAERFGFPTGSRICKSCYEKWRYRLKIGRTWEGVAA